MKIGRLALLGVVALVIVFGGCKKQKSGNLTIQFKPLYNGQNMALNTNYADSGGRTLLFSALHFYLAHITLTGNDKSTNELASAEFLDVANPASLTLNFSNLKGDYQSVSFGCGLDSVQNNTDPNSVPADSPLNGLNDMYWPMLKYRFEVFEGKWDTTLSAGFLENPLVYHIGGNSLYRNPQLNKSFSICCDNTTTLTIYVDVHKFFYGPAEIINIPTEDQTQSNPSPASELIIANKFADNFSKAFSIQ